MNVQHRYVELDWLRVILILAVFLHHVGMPFNGDGYHIMNAQSSKLLDDIMVYFEQFRMPMLFLIAGASSTLVLKVISKSDFVKRRLLRLLVPLVVAVLFIVPPQNYIEHIDKYDSYWTAWPELAMQLSSNHLWFIEFLMVYMLVGVGFYALLASNAGRRLLDGLQWLVHRRFGLLSLTIAMIGFKVTLKLMHPEYDKWLGNLSFTLYYGFFYFFGMMLIARNAIWHRLREQRRLHQGALLLCSIVFYGYYYSPDLSEYLSLQQRWMIWWAVTAMVTWTGALTILGYAQQYLTQSRQWLSQCNLMIYPFYILHQTILILIAYPIVQWQASISVKLLSLLVLSFTATVLCCRLLIYPFNPVRWLFGVKPKQKTDKPVIAGTQYNISN